MSISNHLCGNGPSVGYVQCWVPVQHVDAFKGLVPTVKGLVNKGRAGIWGGDAKQYEAYDHMWASLQDIYKNTNTYKKRGVLADRMKELIAWAEVWENFVAAGKGQADVYPGAVPPGQRPPAYVPAPSAPLPPNTGIAHQWVLVPYYSAPLSSSRWSCHAP